LEAKKEAKERKEMKDKLMKEKKRPKHVENKETRKTREATAKRKAKAKAKEEKKLAEEKEEKVKEKGWDTTKTDSPEKVAGPETGQENRLKIEQTQSLSFQMSLRLHQLFRKANQPPQLLNFRFRLL
jgi:cobalamin-dependent methionine synthase I